MIDFSCCEVQKAVKALYSDNEVLGIYPIVKPKGEKLINDSKTIYYGIFTNPSVDTFLSYEGNLLENNGVQFFDSAENALFDFFQGYQINLKNKLSKKVVSPYLTINLYYDDFVPVPQKLEWEFQGQILEMNDGYKIPISVLDGGISFWLVEPEPISLKVNGVQVLNASNVTVIIDDFIEDGDNYRLDITYFNLEI